MPCANQQDSRQYSVFHVGGISPIQQKPCGCQGLEVGMTLACEDTYKDFQCDRIGQYFFLGGTMGSQHIFKKHQMV